MIDKVQKIKEWISKEQDGLMDANGNFRTAADEASYNTLCNLDAYIDSMQKEPISEKLKEVATQYGTEEFPKLCCGCKHIPCDAFIDGYRQAEEDSELTWKDLATIEKLGDDFFKQNHTPMSDEEFYKEVLKRFKDYKERKEV